MGNKVTPKVFNKYWFALYGIYSIALLAASLVSAYLLVSKRNNIKSEIVDKVEENTADVVQMEDKLSLELLYVQEEMKRLMLLELPYLQTPLAAKLTYDEQGGYTYLEDLKDTLQKAFPIGLRVDSDFEVMPLHERKLLLSCLKVSHMVQVTSEFHSSIEQILFLHPNMMVWCPSDYTFAEFAPRHLFEAHQYVFQPTQNGHVQYWSASYYHEPEEKNMVSFTMPVDVKNPDMGLFTIELDFDSFQESLSKGQARIGKIEFKNRATKFPNAGQNKQLQKKTSTGKPAGSDLANRILNSVELEEREGQFLHADGNLVYFKKVNSSDFYTIFYVPLENYYFEVGKEAGLILTTILFLLGITVWILHRFMHQKFVIPAFLLVKHLQHEGAISAENPMPKNMPGIWKGWFNDISFIFSEKQKLVSLLENQNELLEKKVSDRTLRLQEKNQKIEEQFNLLHERNQQLEDARETIEKQHQKLQHYAGNLALQIEERTESMLKAQNELAELNKELDTIIYRLSHDLLGPLKTLMGLINVSLIENPDSSYLGLLKGSAEQMNMLLTQLLKLVHIRNTEVNPDKSNIVKLLKSEVEYLAENYDFDPESFEFKHTQDFVLSIDEILLSSIFNNLFQNAVQYCTSKEKMEVMVDLKQKGEVLEILVLDNGKGISEQDENRIFDIFYKSSEQDDRQHFGLGLYMARKAANKLNGDIYYVGTRKNMTTFKVILPLAYQKEELDESEKKH